MPVGALGEGEQARDAFDDLVRALRLARIGFGHAGGPGVDPEARAGRAKRRAVGALVAFAEHLVDVLVGGLVLEDLDYRAPGGLHHEIARNLDRSRARHPTTEVRAGPDHFECGRRQRRLEKTAVDVIPSDPELAHERRLERGR